MAVSATLSLDDRERELLARILGVPKSKLEQELAPYATAALEEWTRMFTGERVYTRAGDLREYRLFLLIKHVWKRVPANRQVSALFQTTPAQSRTLVRNVLSKYQYELDRTLEDELRAAVGAAKQRPDESAYTLVLDSPNLADALNALIERIDRGGELPSLTPSGTSANAYKLQPSTLEALRKHFGDA